MSFNFSLKSAIDGVNNPSIGGTFRYGKMTPANAFTLFDVYEYEDNTPYLGGAFDVSRVLCWKMSQASDPGGFVKYPQIAYQNLTPNVNVSPQPFPTQGIYMHPETSPTTRTDAAVRFTSPINAQMVIDSTVQKADVSCGDGIGYRILKNGVEVLARTIIAPSVTPTLFNTTINIIAGDVIDFVGDAGDSLNNICDDISLEVAIQLNFSQLPTPMVTTSNIDCSTVSISGTTQFVGTDVTIKAYDSTGTTLLGSSAVTVSGYQGTFTIQPINLSSYGGQNIIIRAEDGGVTPNSENIVLLVGNAGCEVSEELPSPTISTLNLCKKKCSYQRVVTGTTDLPDKSLIALYKHPISTTGTNYLIGAASVTAGVWTVSSEDIISEKYVAFGVRLDGITGGTVTIDATQNCEKQCILVGDFSGVSTGITAGIIGLYETATDNLVATGVIKDSAWSIKDDLVVNDIDEYYIRSIKLT